MPVYKTNRGRTITLEGEVVIPLHQKAEADPIQPGDTWIAEYAEGWCNLSFCNVDFRFAGYPDYFDDVTSNAATMYAFGYITCDALGIAEYDETGVLYGDYTPRTRPLTVDDAGEYTYTFSVDVDEYVVADTPDDGWTLVDGEYWPDGSNFQDPTMVGSYQTDGLAMMGHAYYELPRVGGELNVTLTGPFGLSLSATHTFTGAEDFPIGYTVARELSTDCINYTNTVSATAVAMGTEDLGYSFTDAYSYGTGSGDIDFTAPSVVVEHTDSAGYPGGVSGSQAIAYNRMKERWSVEGIARDLDGGLATGATYRVETDTWNHEFSANSSAYDFDLRFDVGIPKPCGIIRPGFAVDEVGSLRAFVKTFPTSDDSRDWRLMFQTWAWHALTVEQASEYQVIDGPQLFTEAANTVTPLTDIWEGYGYAFIPTSGTGYSGMGASTVLTLDFADRSYPFKPEDITTATAPYNGLYFDLVVPPQGTMPEEFEGVDERDSRFPLIQDGGGGYGPTTGHPQVDDEADGQDGTLSVPQQGILSGVLKRVDSVSVGGIAAATESLTPGFTMGELYLKRRGTSKARVLQSFKNDILGWVSPTDHTYLSPLLWLYCDGKQVAPWPHRAHVQPDTGSDRYFVFWDLDTLAGFVSYIPGWTGTVETAQAWPALASDTSVKWRSGTLYAGNIPEWYHNETEWLDQTDKSVDANIWAALLADEINAYPGCGNPWADDRDARFPLRTQKVFRGLADGVVGDQSTHGNDVSNTESWRLPDALVKIIRQSDDASRGEGTTDSDGVYETGSPWANGNVNHRTERQSDVHPYDGPFKTANRYRHRTSFLAIGVVNGTFPSYDVNAGMRHIRAYLRGGNAYTAYADNAFSGGWTERPTGLAATSVAIRWDRESKKQRLLMQIEDAGSVKLYESNDIGDSWALLRTIGTGVKPGFCVVGGRTYSYRIDGTAVKYDISDGTTILSGTLATPASVDDAGVAVCGSVIRGGKLRLILEVVVSGVVTQYVSDDGIDFS